MNLNKKSVKQDGGPSHQMPDGTTMPGATHGESMAPPQQEVDPAIQEIGQYFAQSVQQGSKPEEVIMTLLEQQVDQNIIAQALMMVGYEENELQQLFQTVQELSQPQQASGPEVTRDPQELARNEAIAAEQEGLDVAVEEVDIAKSGIEIKPENKGKFTAWAKARGMSVKEAYTKVMANTDAYPPRIVKMANFAKNAAGFKKQEGGGTDYTEGVRQREGSYNAPNRKYTLDPRFKQEGGEQTPEMIEYLKALEFNKKARQAVGTNDKELLASFTSRIKSNTPYGERELARDFSELQKLRQAAGLGLMEEASILLPHVGQQLRGSFNQILGTNLKEGGEFEPHFMYKGERKIRAKDMETHLRLKEAGYGHDAPKAQTGLEVDKKGNTFIDGVVQAKDEWTAAPSYVNPLAFESGNNFSLTDGLQVLGTGINKLLGSGDKNEDGLRDGFLRDAKGKRALRNQQKGDYYNYEIKLDLNDPNAYGYDNLDLYNISKGNGGLRDLQTFTDDVKENSTIQSNQPSLLDKVGTGLNEAGEFIKDKYNEAKPFIQQGVDQAGKSIMQAGDFVEDKVNTGLDFLKNIKFKEGGDLPKAQEGMFDFNFTEDQLKDQGDYFSNLLSGQTNYMQDTQVVADAQLQKKQPNLGPTPLEQNNLSLFTAQTDQEEENQTNTFDDPTVKRTNKFQGGFNRFMDSPGMKGYTGGSEFAVQGARVVNNFFDDRAIEDAQADNRNNMVADNLYATKENPMLKRGAWDINTGTFGSEGQRTVRTNMGIAKEGGEMATVDSLLLAKLIAAGADIEIL